MFFGAGGRAEGGEVSLVPLRIWCLLRTSSPQETMQIYTFFTNNFRGPWELYYVSIHFYVPVQQQFIAFEPLSASGRIKSFPSWAWPQIDLVWLQKKKNQSFQSLPHPPSQYPWALPLAQIFLIWLSTMCSLLLLPNLASPNLECLVRPPGCPHQLNSAGSILALKGFIYQPPPSPLQSLLWGATIMTP